MKKLISVFAALALVGSLAAQKGKKAPAKPAAPAAPAAPKAPAMPAAVTAAPAAASAAKGMGLFIDLRGSYTFSNGSTTAAADGSDASTATTTTAVTYKTSGTAGFGGGASIGYDIAQGLGLVASFDYRAVASREYKNKVNSSSVGATAGGFADRVDQTKINSMVLGLGLRPHVNALGGEIYGGAGLAVVLPFDYTATRTYAGDATWTTNTGALTKTEQVTKYNMAFGAYGEVGYKYFFTENIGLVLGLRAVVATVDNKDKTQVTTNTATTTTTTTTTYGDSLSSTDQASVTVGTATTNKKPFETFGVTDFSANVGIALKF